jgi:hypothetical protein
MKTLIFGIILAFVTITVLNAQKVYIAIQLLILMEMTSPWSNSKAKK